MTVELPAVLPAMLPDTYIIGPVVMREADLPPRERERDRLAHGEVCLGASADRSTMGDSEDIEDSDIDSDSEEAVAILDRETYDSLPTRKLMVVVRRTNLDDLLSTSAADIRPLKSPRIGAIAKGAPRKTRDMESIAAEIFKFIDWIAAEGEVGKTIREAIPGIRENYAMFLRVTRERLLAAQAAKDWVRFAKLAVEFRDLISEALIPLKELVADGAFVFGLEDEIRTIITDRVNEMQQASVRYDPRRFILGDDGGDKYIVWKGYSAVGSHGMGKPVVFPVVEATGSSDYFLVSFDRSNDDLNSIIRRHLLYVTRSPNPIAFSASVRLPSGDRASGWLVFAPFLPTFLDQLAKVAAERMLVFRSSRTADLWRPEFDFVFPLRSNETDYTGNLRGRGHTTLDLLTEVGDELVGRPAEVDRPQVEGFPTAKRPISMVELALMPVQPVDVEFLRKLGWLINNPQRQTRRDVAAFAEHIYEHLLHAIARDVRVSIHAIFGVPGSGYVFPPAATWESMFDLYARWISECRRVQTTTGLVGSRGRKPGDMRDTRYPIVAERARENLSRIEAFYRGSYAMIERNKAFYEKLRIEKEMIEMKQRAQKLAAERKIAAGKEKIRAALLKRKKDEDGDD